MSYLSCPRVTAFGRNLNAHRSTFGGKLFEHYTPVKISMKQGVKDQLSFS